MLDDVPGSERRDGAAAEGATSVSPVVVAETPAALLGLTRRLRDGERIGGYTIARRLGMGGMGEVYLALDERLRREVAIKLVRPGTFGEALVGRDVLLREAQALARVTHPNIVTVYEV